MFAVLGPLGTYVGSLRPLLEPMLAVLGRSRGLCCRSGAALGPYVGGLGSLLGPMLAVLGRSRGLSWRSWPLLGPPKAVLGRDHAEKRPKAGKVAQTPA